MERVFTALSNRWDNKYTDLYGLYYICICTCSITFVYLSLCCFRNSVTVQDDKEVVPMAVSSVKQESKAPTSSLKKLAEHEILYIL